MPCTADKCMGHEGLLPERAWRELLLQCEVVERVKWLEAKCSSAGECPQGSPRQGLGTPAARLHSCCLCQEKQN